MKRAVFQYRDHQPGRKEIIYSCVLLGKQNRGLSKYSVFFFGDLTNDIHVYNEQNKKVLTLIRGYPLKKSCKKKKKCLTGSTIPS